MYARYERLLQYLPLLTFPYLGYTLFLLYHLVDMLLDLTFQFFLLRFS